MLSIVLSKFDSLPMPSIHDYANMSICMLEMFELYLGVVFVCLYSVHTNTHAWKLIRVKFKVMVKLSAQCKCLVVLFRETRCRFLDKVLGL